MDLGNLVLKIDNNLLHENLKLKRQLLYYEDFLERQMDIISDRIDEIQHCNNNGLQIQHDDPDQCISCGLYHLTDKYSIDTQKECFCLRHVDYEKWYRKTLCKTCYKERKCKICFKKTLICGAEKCYICVNK